MHYDRGEKGLRGLCIFFIAFIYHYSCVYGVLSNNAIYSYLQMNGYLAVEVFFTISGYCIYEKYKNSDNVSFNHFMLLRLTKLWPLAAISTTICGLQAIIISFYNLDIMSHVIPYNTLSNFVFSLALAQTSIFPNSATYGQVFNLPLWFVSVLIVCYIYFYIVKRSKKNSNIVILIALVIYIFVLKHSIYNNELPILNYFTARGIIAFSLGMICAKIKIFFENKPIFVWLALILSGGWVLLDYYNTNSLGDRLLTFDIFVAIPLLLCVVTQSAF